MTISCPQCGETEQRTLLRQPFRFSVGLCFFGFLGGCIGGIFYMLGQQSKFKCGKCDQIFFSHTAFSRVFWVLAIVTYLAVTIGIGYSVWTTFRAPP